MMIKEGLITTREVSRILGISEKDIIELANSNLLPHFKVAGEFLRFRKQDIANVRESIKQKYNLPNKKIHKRERKRPCESCHRFILPWVFLSREASWRRYSFLSLKFMRPRQAEL